MMTAANCDGHLCWLLSRIIEIAIMQCAFELEAFPINVSKTKEKGDEGCCKVWQAARLQFFEHHGLMTKHGEECCKFW